MDAIASASSASWYHSGTPKLSSKQCLCIYKDPCLARACWAQPKPVALHRADADFAFLQNALSALRRSAQPSRKRDVHRGLGLHPNKQNTHGKFAMPCVFWPLCAQRHCLLEQSTIQNLFFVERRNPEISNHYYVFQTVMR